MTTRVIECLVPIALKEAMDVLGPEFEAESGYQLNITHMLNPEVPDSIAAGFKWDIALTNPWHVDEIIAAGHAGHDSHYTLGRSPLAFARCGTGKVHLLQTAEEIADMLRNVKSIAITATGTSGDMFRDLAKKLGVLTDIESVIIPMEGGEPVRSLVAGEVEMASVPLTNIVTINGIVPVAICPENLNVHIDFSFCVNPLTVSPVRELVQWLTAAARSASLETLGVTRVVHMT